MTIVADGERSRKRVPIAKKALGVITDMDLPAKAGLYEGFFYKVWQMGEISGGRVVAPFGVFVLLSDETGIKQFVCDSAECAAGGVFDPLVGDRYVTVYEANPAGYSIYVSGGADGVPVLADPLVYVDPNPAYQWKAAQPVCIPFSGELVAINAAYQRTPGNNVNYSLATHCFSDGKVDVQAHGISGIAALDAYAGNSTFRVTPMLTTQGYLERLLWKMAFPFYANYLTGQPALFVEYQYYYAPTQVAAAALRVTGTDVYGGASAGLQAKLAYHNPSVLLPVSVGHFGIRTDTDVKGVLATYVYAQYDTGCTPEQIADPTSVCIDYAADSNWLCSLTFYSVTGGTQVVGYTTLAPLFDGLAAGELYGVFAPPTNGYISTPTNGGKILSRLFGYGADDEALEYVDGYYMEPARDTVTFGDASGVVYSWLRRCDPAATQRADVVVGERKGGFKFQYPEGFVRTPLTMPTDVLTDVTLRPRITLMTATTYCCIADTAAGEIKHLYVGSPFASWAEVALPAGATMYAIRVLQPGDSTATAGFIGVGKVPATDTATESYRIFMKLAGAASWSMLSALPVSGVNDLIASWDVCVFGDDPLVAASQWVRQHPVAGQSRRHQLR